VAGKDRARRRRAAVCDPHQPPVGRGQRPDSRTALGRIDGLGDKKLDRYAKALLAQLRPDPTAPTDAGETDTETAQPEEETTS
jgi:hypothetical protein